MVAFRAWNLLNEPEANEDRKADVAAPARAAEDVAFFPLTMPFTTGPGTMKVWSPGSTGTSLGAPGCGNPSGPWPQDLPVPQNGLIFVQNTPSGTTSPAPGPCAAKSLGTGAGGSDLPRADDWGQTQAEADCRLGTAYKPLAIGNSIVVSIVYYQLVAVH